MTATRRRGKGGRPRSDVLTSDKPSVGAVGRRCGGGGRQGRRRRVRGGSAAAAPRRRPSFQDGNSPVAREQTSARTAMSTERRARDETASATASAGERPSRARSSGATRRRAADAGPPPELRARRTAPCATRAAGAASSAARSSPASPPSSPASGPSAGRPPRRSAAPSATSSAPSPCAASSTCPTSRPSEWVVKVDGLVDTPLTVDRTDVDEPPAHERDRRLPLRRGLGRGRRALGRRGAVRAARPGRRQAGGEVRGLPRLRRRVPEQPAARPDPGRADRCSPTR